MKYKIFGCKTNKYYTEKWLNTKYLEDKKGVFVASCIVTEKAKAKWLKFVLSTINDFEGEEEKLYLSGCGTIKNGSLVDDFYFSYPELSEFKDKIVLLSEDPAKEGLNSKTPSFISKNIFTRKYLIIQNGCDNFCTFCLTIQARGKHFSRKSEDVISEVLEFTNKGGKEIVLTGTNLGAWGTSNTKKFNESKFPHLLKEILNKTPVERIRISSLGIEYISDELIELLKNPRIYGHVHLSIQSGSDKILKSMNRNYTKSTLEEKLDKLRSLKRQDSIYLSIGADMIVGFPGEEDSDFEDSVKLIEKYKITKVHAFPFSAHENRDSIPAALFPDQVKEHIKHQRMKRIIEIGDDIRTSFLKENSGKRFNLLVEKISSKQFSGWSENYISLNESNFFIDYEEQPKHGSIISGVYRYNADVKEKFESEIN